MDPTDEAIASSAQPTEQLTQLTVTIASTGRHVVIAFPLDMTDGELLEVIGWAATNLRAALAQERAKGAGGRIILPHGVLPS